MAKKMVKLFFVFFILFILIVGIMSSINNQRTFSANDKSLVNFSMKFQMKDLREDFNYLLNKSSEKEKRNIQHLLKKKDKHEVFVKLSMLADNIKIDAEKTINSEVCYINFSQTKKSSFTLESEIVLTVIDENDEFSMIVDYIFFEKLINKDREVKVTFTKK